MEEKSEFTQVRELRKPKLCIHSKLTGSSSSERRAGATFSSQPSPCLGFSGAVVYGWSLALPAQRRKVLSVVAARICARGPQLLRQRFFAGLHGPELLDAFGRKLN